MKKPCPHCGHTEAFTVRKAQIPNYEYSNSIEPMTLTAHYGESGRSGLFGAIKKRVGIQMSARVCAECGFVSWFVSDMEQLKSFADNGWGGVSGPR